jgi:hypothetical protein
MSPDNGRLRTHVQAILRRRMVHVRNYWFKLLYDQSEG